MDMTGTRTSAASHALRMIGLVAAAVGAFIVLTTLYGVRRFYSPVPWWDEWDGYVGFYIAATNGIVAHAWWYPHMEHRIITSRLLFWLDLRYFHGNHILLFAAQLGMLAGIVAIMQRAYSKGREVATPALWVAGLSAALMFSWAQSEVLKWGFETQVIGAYFFAVCAFFAFTRFDSPLPWRFASGFVLAALAEFSMGNGLAALIALFLTTVLARRGARETLLAGAIAAVLLGVYAIGYVSPPVPKVHLPLVETLTLMAQFFVVFLGNPFGIVFGVSGAAVAGVVALAAAATAIPLLWWRREITPYRAFLIACVLFVLASDAAAMLGRYAGDGAALASRYTTGPLLVWLALLLLAFDVLRSNLVVLLGVAVAAALALNQQAIMAPNDNLYEWKLSLLSQKIGLERTSLTGQVFPLDAHDRFLQYANYSAAHQLGIYGREWLRDAGEVKYSADHRDDNWCRGHVDRIKTDAVGPVLSGWAAGPHADLLIVLANDAGKTIGYGVTGQRRDDVSQAIKGMPRTTGWVGFAKPTDGPLFAYAYTDGTFCKLGEIQSGAAQ